MRKLVLLSLLSVSLLGGCFPLTPRNPDAGMTVATTTTAEQLVAALNDNADRIQAVESTQIDLDVSQRFQTFGLQAKLVCARPKYFRMAAYFSGSEMVDMGSNDQEFWFWVSKADPPYLYHCAYTDFDTGRARLPLPFQPEWVMEALGMARYDASKCQVLARGGSVQVIQQARGPDGQPVRKITLVNRNAANQVQVVGHQLVDAKGKMICEARVTALQKDPRSGGILPRQVVLSWPAEKITLKMRLDGTTVNRQFSQDQIATLFTRPGLRGVPGYDLAHGPDQPYGQAQRTNARGFVR